MAVITRAWTSTNTSEIAECLQTLVSLSACSGLTHESVNVNSAGDYSRPWFAWANSLFGHLILKIADERPYLIFS
jgi:meiotically up-regulated gene 157 (Mug157) protein